MTLAREYLCAQVTHEFDGRRPQISSGRMAVREPIHRPQAGASQGVQLWRALYPIPSSS